MLYWPGEFLLAVKQPINPNNCKSMQHSAYKYCANSKEIGKIDAA